jgi:hypothetical protein
MSSRGKRQEAGRPKRHTHIALSEHRRLVTRLMKQINLLEQGNKLLCSDLEFLKVEKLRTLLPALRDLLAMWDRRDGGQWTAKDTLRIAEIRELVQPAPTKGWTP